MHVQYTTLLIAAALSCGAILLSLLVSWANTRKAAYLGLGASGVGLVALALGLMGLRNGQFTLLTLLVPFTLLLLGLTLNYASIRLFLHRANPWPPVLAGTVAIVANAIPFLMGWMGVGGIMINALVAALMFLCAIENLRAREGLRSVTLTLAGLYTLIASSYFMTASYQVIKGEWILYPVTETWYDSANAIISLIAATGIGALTLTLHFARAARLHHAEANTDPLTGVLNRRALFGRFAETAVIPGLPVLLFDLDFFKLINDHLGHAQGDVVLQEFSAILRAHAQNGEVVARIGGEEFCMVLPGRDRAAARTRAEEIRAAFAALAIPSGRPNATATVSVGLATCGGGETFVSVLSRADAALYKAKSEGRNRVQLSERQLAA